MNSGEIDIEMFATGTTNTGNDPVNQNLKSEGLTYQDVSMSDFTNLLDQIYFRVVWSCGSTG